MRAFLAFALAAAVSTVGCASAKSTDFKYQVLNLTQSRDFIFSSPSGRLIALSTAAGDQPTVEVWNLTGTAARLSGQLTLPSAIGMNHQGFVELSETHAFVSTGSGLQAYDLQTKQVVWQDEALSNPWGPAYSHALNMVFVTSTESGHVFAYDAATGARTWNLTDRAYANQPFVVEKADDSSIATRVVIKAQSGILYSFDGRTGAAQWAGAASANVYSTSSRLQMFVDWEFSVPYLVYWGVPTGPSTLVKLDGTTGNVAWTSAIGDARAKVVELPMEVAFTYSTFNFWCYNGSRVAQVSPRDGSTVHSAALPSGVTTMGGLINFSNDYIMSVSIGGTAMAYFDEMGGSSQGTFALPAGNAVSAIRLGHVGPDSRGAILTDASTVVVVESAGWGRPREGRRAQGRRV